MKNLNYKQFTNPFKALIMIAIISLSFTACKEDEDPIDMPVADYDVLIEGKTITLTNNSENTTTYTWEFGDDNTSTDASPSHTYEANGSYVIKLTVTNEAGEDSKQEAIEIVNISIDGDFSDWDNVAEVDHVASGTFTKVKIDNLAKDKLFIYVEMTSEATSFFDFYMNTDYDITGESDTTGFLAGGYSGSFGADVLFEGFFGSDAGTAVSAMFYGVFNADAGVDFAAREEPVLDPNMLSLTELTEIPGGLAMEFSIDLAFLPTDVAVSDNIQIFIDEWNNPADDTSVWWAAFSGKFPEPNVLDSENLIISTPITYTFK